MESHYRRCVNAPTVVPPGSRNGNRYQLGLWHVRNMSGFDHRQSETAHAGLGPTAEDYGNLEYTWPAWWQIAAWDPDKACMYEAEFVFTKTETGGLTFEQTTGPAFVPGTYAGKIGVEGDVCHGEDGAPDLYGVKNVSFSPSSSEAAIDGGYRGTTMNFSDGGFMCWWVGTSEYDIIEVTDNILRVRIKEDDTYSWYHIFTSTKPEQK